MMSENKSDRIIMLLEEILKWTRFQGWRGVKDVLLDTLNDDISKLIYHYSDGKGSREVATLAGLKSHKTVLNYWKKWAILGIVEPLKVQRGIRYKRSFSLSDFGIEIPKIKTETEEVEAKGKPKSIDEEKGSGEQ